jgi:hypothetical protein
MPFYNTKLTLSGSTLEVFTYARPILYGQTIQKSTAHRAHGRKANNPKKPFIHNLYRTKNNLRRIVLSNVSQATTPKFITLTFRDEIQDLAYANQCLHKFILRLNYHLQTKLQYVAVPEIQKKRESLYGAAVWHYHLIIFNLATLPDIQLPGLPVIPNLHPWLTDQWTYGFAFYKSTFNNPVHAANYMAKYLSKDHWEIKLYGKKKYTTSKGLKRPFTQTDPTLTQYLLEQLGSLLPKFSKSVDLPEYYQSIKRERYELTSEQLPFIQTLISL